MKLTYQSAALGGVVALTAGVVWLAGSSAASASDNAAPAPKSDSHVQVYRIKGVAESGAKRAFLGVQVREEARDSEGGARVVEVTDGSPAEKAGIREGDVIVSLDGSPVRGPAMLIERLRAAKPGDKVSVRVQREGRTMDLNAELSAKQATVFSWKGMDSLEDLDDLEGLEGLEGFEGIELGELSDPEARAELEKHLAELDSRMPELQEHLRQLELERVPGGDVHVFISGRPLLGVELTDTTPELRKHLGGSDDRGVLVARVLDDSAARSAGVQVGDLILSVNGVGVADAGDLMRELHRNAGKTVDLEIVRDRNTRKIQATLPAVKEGRKVIRTPDADDDDDEEDAEAPEAEEGGALFMPMEPRSPAAPPGANVVSL